MGYQFSLDIQTLTKKKHSRPFQDFKAHPNPWSDRKIVFCLTSWNILNLGVILQFPWNTNLDFCSRKPRVLLKELIKSHDVNPQQVLTFRKFLARRRLRYNIPKWGNSRRSVEKHHHQTTLTTQWLKQCLLQPSNKWRFSSQTKMLQQKHCFPFRLVKHCFPFGFIFGIAFFCLDKRLFQIVTSKNFELPRGNQQQLWL